MKRVTPALVTLLMLGVVGFLVVAYVAKKYLFAAPAEAAKVARRNIPTAIVEIKPGTRITERHLGVAPIAVDRISPQTLVSTRVILGRIARETIKPLSQIRTEDLYPPGDGPEISIAPGMRAVTVRLGSEADVVDNLIRPGQFVDVHFHASNATGDRRLRNGMVMTLFEGVKVVAVNRSFQPTDSNRSGTTVTFELTEEQANVMLVARDHGDITLAYTPEGRGTGGVTVSDAGRAYLEEVLGLEPLPEPEKPFTTDHYRGSGLNSLQFGKDGRLYQGGDRNGNFGGYSLYNDLRGGTGYGGNRGSQKIDPDRSTSQLPNTPGTQRQAARRPLKPIGQRSNDKRTSGR